ncbi:MAG TPA: hypothetical protein VGW12_19885 [Pyrinomonadaceae bacterium]|nr:hypothetical protein [Pyrinomonadaceae bacterium]
MTWYKYEFIECLGVLPEVGEDDLSFSYRVEKDGLRLELTVFPRGGDLYEAGDVYLDLYREGIEQPVFSTRIMESPGARYIKHTNGWECLEIAAPHRNVSFEEEWIFPMGMRVRVNPHISVEMFQPPAG